MSLEELAMVITSSQLRMSDSERLAAIDRIFRDVQDKLVFLRDFNGKVRGLEQLRESRRRDVLRVRDFYGDN